MASAAKGDVAAVEAELSRQPELARTSNETGETALHQAEVESSCTPMSQAARDEELAALLGAHGGRQQAASDRDRAQRLVEAGRLDEAEKPRHHNFPSDASRIRAIAVVCVCHSRVSRVSFARPGAVRL
jgi:hypothetical protein